ncbi:MAG: dTDP-4-dehydrorhamnose reductase [Candidatus Omnitrophica bacterium]|nr:dTDP-4-dehydrorhamnose reductase [Candidatus Omnitrophota bacterium]
MKKIIITGGNGLVGRYLNSVFEKKKYKIFSFSKEEMNTTDRETCYKIFKEIRPDIVIHLAALTDVDFCEKNPEIAYKVNSEGTKNISEISSYFNSFIIYLSTDFVFDGKKGTPYTEKDEPNPINVYGKSKLKGEEFILSNCLKEKFLIIRTSRIFGKNGKSFGSKLPLIMKEKKEIFLTTDIINSPTYVLELANSIKKLIEKYFYGIINICNNNWCSWYEFGIKMKEILKSEIKIKGITFEEYGKIFNVYAKRPKFSALSIDLLNSLNIKMRPWEKSLKIFLNKDLKIWEKDAINSIRKGDIYEKS